MNWYEVYEAYKEICAIAASTSQEIDVPNESPERPCETHDAWEQYKRAAEFAESSLRLLFSAARLRATSGFMPRGALTRRWAAATGE